MTDCGDKAGRRPRKPEHLALFLAAVLFAAGCSESVDTRLRIDYPYSVYGLINPKLDTHAVRVFEIKSEIMLVRPDPIDARVSTTLLQTGEQSTWQDSLIQLSDGDYRHVFWSMFSASSGETYRLEVRRSDGEVTSAETTIPPLVELEVLEPDTLHPREALMPVLIRGRPPNMPRIDVEYVVAGFREEGSEAIFKPVTFNYAQRPSPADEGYLLEVDLIADYAEIFQKFDDDNDVTTDIIDLREIIVRIHVGDENWASPTGFFDADLLVEPGTFSNVNNGFGYFGSGYVESISFRPPLILLRRAGFYIAGEGG